MSTCRTCDVCEICGQYYLKRQGQVCKYFNAKQVENYGFDCEELSCPFCKFCSIEHCSSDTRLLKALEIRKQNYLQSTKDIAKKLTRKKREYVNSITEILSNIKECID